MSSSTSNLQVISRIHASTKLLKVAFVQTSHVHCFSSSFTIRIYSDYEFSFDLCFSCGLVKFETPSFKRKNIEGMDTFDTDSYIVKLLVFVNNGVIFIFFTSILLDLCTVSFLLLHS